MINFIESEKVFKEYLKNYNYDDGNIKLKTIHTYGVVKCSEFIAKELGLSSEDIELAKLIALLHDIGRFEQTKTTNSFLDYQGFDHAEYGAKILFEDNMIRKFIDDNRYDNIIYKAIINHNKLKIEENLNDIELLHVKLIRDADKLDNFRVKEKENFENMFSYNPDTIEHESITPKVYEEFMNCQTILTTDRKTQIDIWISYIAFIFDLNFKVSLEYLQQRNYIDILVDRIDYKNEDTKNKMEQIRKKAKDFLNMIKEG